MQRQVQHHLIMAQAGLSEVAFTYVILKHTTTLFSLSDHYILCRDWRLIVDLVQTIYHGRSTVSKSVRCDSAVDYEGYLLWSDVF